MKRGIVMFGMIVILVACEKDTKDTSQWGVGNMSASTSTSAAKPVAATADSEKQCIGAIIKLNNTRQDKGRTAALEIAMTSTESCAAYCSPIPQPPDARTEACNVPVSFLREACTDNVLDCADLCKSQELSPFARVAACAFATSAKEETSTLRMGDKVQAQWRNGTYYPGTVTAVYSDGTADVRYDDGDRSKGLPFSKIRLVKRPLFEAAVKSQPAKKKQGLVEGASCAGVGWQYVCGGRCTDTKTDSANCGKCGNRCDSGYSCDGSGTCRDASGNL